MSRLHLVLRALLLLPLPALATEPEWVLIDQNDGVAVYRKEVEGSPVVAFKGEAELEATPEQVLWVLATNERRTEWVDLCAESRVLESRARYDQVIYQRFKLPWYLSDRDYVYRARAVSRPDGRVELLLASCESDQAPATCGVRARLIASRYVLTPLEGGKRTRIAVEIHTDPMGMVPKWLVNLVQEEWPKKTLAGIRTQLQKPDVGRVELPPVEREEAAVEAGAPKAAPVGAKPASAPR